MSCFQRPNPKKLPPPPKENQAPLKNSAPQSYYLSILSHNQVTLPLCVSSSSGTLVLQNIPSFHCYHIIGSQTIQSRKLPINQKAFFFAIETTKNHLECTHTQRQTNKSPYQIEVRFPGMKRVPTHHKDSQIYNPSFSKDTRVYV